MEERKNKINRRNFLKAMGAAGLAPALAGMKSADASGKAGDKKKEAKFPQVPRRKLGKTGVDVSCLSMGGEFSILDNQIILRKALQWGVNYWDTGSGYAGGNSELGIGKFLAKNPEVRKELFICTKAMGTRDLKQVEKLLQNSLKRLNTDYIDFYVGCHGLSNPADLTDELKQWAESAKKRGLIRFFGFATHKNMPECLAAAAKLDWIDVILTLYNFRFAQDAKMQAAIEACYKAGIGLVAIKTLGHGLRQPWAGNRISIETEEDKKLAEHFLQRGFTEAQAKIKIVLEDKRISSACVRNENVALLTENAAAALDMTKLTQADTQVLNQYAQASCSGYCAGCANICDAALPDTPYVSDVMRYLMYYNSYGDHDRARELFAQIPAGVKSKLLSTNYRLAEARCPQHLPIGKLVAEAVSKLA